MTERRRLDVLLMLLGLVLFGEPPARAEADDELLWRETTRDVYVDGRLDRQAIVLRVAKPPTLAVLRDRVDTSPVVVDTESLELRRIALADLTFGERGWEARTKGKFRALQRGGATRVDDSTLLLTTDDGYLIVAPHAGVRGSTSRDEIFGALPSWKALYERYVPDADALRTLSEIQEDVRLTLALGTWCGDSKREVPRLLKALDQAANSRIRLDIVGLSREFDEPQGVMSRHKLTNVPTLIVSRGDEEIGRIVETPAGDSMAADLARILTRQPVHHEGRWSRSDRLARGRYSIVDASGAETGVEDWELFSDAEGGTLMHAWTVRGGKATEIWHRRDTDGLSSFIEITRTDDPWHSRSRHWITRPEEPGASRALRSLTRGNGTGVIRQSAVLEERSVVVSPSVADQGRAAGAVATSQGPTTRPAMILGPAGEAATARLGRLELNTRDAEAVTTAAGTFSANRVSGHFGGAFVDVWLHDKLNIPIRWKHSGGHEIVLTQLETF